MSEAQQIAICSNEMHKISLSFSELLQKHGLEGFATLLEQLKTIDKVITRNTTCEPFEQVLHKFILDELCKIYKVKDRSVLLDGVKRIHSEARMIGIYLLKENTNLYVSQIATLYRMDASNTSKYYKKMNELKDFKYNTDRLNKFQAVKNSVTSFKSLLNQQDEQRKR